MIGKWFSDFLTAWGARIVIAALIGLLSWGVYMAVKKIGGDEVRLDQMEKVDERADDAKKVQNDIRRLPDHDALDKLRRKWSR